MHIAGTRVVTVSIGVAGLAGSGVDEALTRAQAALAEAKEQGGQQVVVDGPTHAHLRASAQGRGQRPCASCVDGRAARTGEAAQAQAEAAQAQAEAARRTSRRAPAR